MHRQTYQNISLERQKRSYDGQRISIHWTAFCDILASFRQSWEIVMKTLNIDEKIRHYSNSDAIKNELIERGKIASYVVVAEKGRRFIEKKYLRNGKISTERIEIR